MVGRKTKCTPEITGVILRALPRVRWLSHAAAMAGISERTVRNWISRGEQALDLEAAGVPMEESEMPFAEFLLKVRAIQADMTGNLAEMIEIAAPDDWKAAAWLLARQDPRHWGDKAHEFRLSVTESAPSAPPLDLRGVTSEELRNRVIELSAGNEEAVDG